MQARRKRSRGSERSGSHISRKHRPGYPQPRRLRVEPLEDRRLLSAAQLELFGLSPALFVENQGQWADESVAFVHQGDGVNVAMTDSGVAFQVFRAVESDADDALEDPSALTPDPSPIGRGEDERAETSFEAIQFSAGFVGANAVAPVGLERAETLFNYCVGAQEDWHSEVPSYEIVAYENLYDGIDLQTWGLRSHLKYEFHVAAGADYGQIAVHYDGIAGLSLAADGSLIVDLGNDWGQLIDDAPYIYQTIDGQQQEVAGHFVLIDSQTYTFELTGEYDSSRELVIDPELAWSTYLGGIDDDYGNGIAVDGDGGVYVTGETFSSGWISGEIETPSGVNRDAFVVKLSDTGDHLWSTYLGGNSIDYGEGIAVDGAGGVYVIGDTNSSGWTSGGFDTSFGGGRDVFVVKLSDTGAHVWSTYLGEGSYDSGYGIAVDGFGGVYATGYVISSGWPSGGLNTSTNVYPDAFVVKLSDNGDHIWSRLLGGTSSDYGYGIAVDESGDVCVTGETRSSSWTSGGYDTIFNDDTNFRDAFVAKLSASGDYIWSTYLGGSRNDHGNGIAIDQAGDVYVTGSTLSSGWISGGFDTSLNGNPGDPAVPDRGDAFVVKLSDTGDHIWSTYLGGSIDDSGRSIAVDGAGSIYVVGLTSSSDWCSGGHDISYNGSTDAFVAKLTASGGHAWSSYLGGGSIDYGRDIALDGAGGIYVTGEAWFSNTDWTSGGFDTSSNGETDAFVARISVPLVLSSGIIEENRPVGTTIGVFSTKDPDAGDTFTYALVEGDGDSDNAQFTIDGDVLQSAAVFDCESQGYYNIRVRSTDQAGLSVENTFIVTVTNVNESPTDIAVAGLSIVEKTSQGQFAGTVLAVDPDVGDTFTYALVDGEGSEDNGLLSLQGASLYTTATIDYETQICLHVRIRATDQGGLSIEKALALEITDVNERPTALHLSHTTIAGGVPVGTLVGLFDTTDPDLNESFTYMLNNGTGGEDNASFTIVGNELRTAETFDPTVKDTYNVRVRSTDHGGLYSVVNAFVISVVEDATGPAATGLVLGGADWSGSPAEGHAIAADGGVQVLPWSGIDRIGIVFDEDVLVERDDIGLFGVNTPQYDVGAWSFSYDAATRTATLALDGPLEADRLLLTIDGVTDLVGNPLEDQVQLRFDVLPGDVNGSGGVVGDDLIRVRNAMGTVSADADYSALMDLDADGLIDGDDLSLVRARLGTALPDGLPEVATDPVEDGLVLAPLAGRTVVLQDILRVANFLYFHGQCAVPDDLGELPFEAELLPNYDVNDDGFIGIQDALLVVAALRNQSALAAEGELPTAEGEQLAAAAVASSLVLSEDVGATSATIVMNEDDSPICPLAAAVVDHFLASTSSRIGRRDRANGRFAWGRHDGPKFPTGQVDPGSKYDGVRPARATRRDLWAELADIDNSETWAAERTPVRVHHAQWDRALRDIADELAEEGEGRLRAFWADEVPAGG